jgi:hypothetical protein
MGRMGVEFLINKLKAGRRGSRSSGSRVTVRQSTSLFIKVYEMENLVKEVI